MSERCIFHGQTFDDLLRRCAHLGERYIVELNVDGERVFAPPGYIVQAVFKARGYMAAVEQVPLADADQEWSRMFDWLVAGEERT